MGNRLSKITTRTGDDGTTGLGDGSRLSKADLRFDAMGIIDGLNAQMGLLQAYLADKLPVVCDEISTIQHKLFNIGGEIALPNHQDIGYIAITASDVAQLGGHRRTMKICPILKNLSCRQARWQPPKRTSHAVSAVMPNGRSSACTSVMAISARRLYSI